MLTFCFIKKGNIEKVDSETPIFFFFLNNSIGFFIPFSIVTLFYSILSIVLSYTNRDTITLKFLVKMNDFFYKLREFVSFFKLTPLHAFIILILLFSFSLIKSYLQKSGAKSNLEINTKIISWLYKLFDIYQKWIRLIYVIAVLLSSFTFFANNITEAASKLEIRIGRIKQSCDDYHSKLNLTIKKEITNEVCSELIQQQLKYPEYQKAIKHSNNIKHIIDELKNIENKKYDIPIVNDKIELNTEKEQRINSALKQVEHERRKSVPSINEIFENQSLTTKKSKSFHTRLKNHNNQVPNKATSLMATMATQGFKRLPPQMLNIFSSIIDTKILKILSHDYPIMEPIYEIFSTTLDDKVKQVSNKIVDNVFSLSIKENNIDLSREIDKRVSIETRKIISLFARDYIFQTNIVKLEQTESDLKNIRKKAERMVDRQIPQKIGDKWPKVSEIKKKDGQRLEQAQGAFVRELLKMDLLKKLKTVHSSFEVLNNDNLDIMGKLSELRKIAKLNFEKPKMSVKYIEESVGVDVLDVWEAKALMARHQREAKERKRYNEWRATMRGGEEQRMREMIRQEIKRAKKVGDIRQMKIMKKMMKEIRREKKGGEAQRMTKMIESEIKRAKARRRK